MYIYPFCNATFGSVSWQALPMVVLGLFQLISFQTHCHWAIDRCRTRNIRWSYIVKYIFVHFSNINNWCSRVTTMNMWLILIQLSNHSKLKSIIHPSLQSRIDKLTSFWSNPKYRTSRRVNWTFNIMASLVFILVFPWLRVHPVSAGADLDTVSFEKWISNWRTS